MDKKGKLNTKLDNEMVEWRNYQFWLQSLVVSHQFSRNPRLTLVLVHKAVQSERIFNNIVIEGNGVPLLEFKSQYLYLLSGEHSTLLSSVLFSFFDINSLSLSLSLFSGSSGSSSFLPKDSIQTSNKNTRHVTYTLASESASRKLLFTISLSLSLSLSLSSRLILTSHFLRTFLNPLYSWFSSERISQWDSDFHFLPFIHPSLNPSPFSLISSFFSCLHPTWSKIPKVWMFAKEQKVAKDCIKLHLAFHFWSLFLPSIIPSSSPFLPSFHLLTTSFTPEQGINERWASVACQQLSWQPVLFSFLPHLLPFHHNYSLYLLVFHSFFPRYYLDTGYLRTRTEHFCTVIRNNKLLDSDQLRSCPYRCHNTNGYTYFNGSKCSPQK